MSMVDPSIDYLAEKVDSKYTLVILAAKRARELTIPGVNSAEKEVSAALKEIANDTIPTSVLKTYNSGRVKPC